MLVMDDGLALLVCFAVLAPHFAPDKTRNEVRVPVQTEDTPSWILH